MFVTLSLFGVTAHGGIGDLVEGAMGEVEDAKCVAIAGKNQTAFDATVTAIKRSKGTLKQKAGIDSSGSCKQKSGQVATAIAAGPGVIQGLLAAEWVKCACEKAY